MANYSAWSVEQLKEFIERNNIWTGCPSGKWGGLIRNDYLVAIKKLSDSLTPKSIIPCEWRLVGSTERCGRTSSLGGFFVRYIVVAFARENLYQLHAEDVTGALKQSCIDVQDALDLVWMII